MSLTDQQIEDNGICRTCRGNAKYKKEVIRPDGTTETVLVFCEACDGTGLDQEDGDVD